MKPDPRPRRRIRDPELLRTMHLAPGRRCALDSDHDPPYSLHHVHKHPRDDVRENLVWLCGSGTTGCHGLVEHHDPDALRLLALYLRFNRPDFVAYLAEKLGTPGQVDDWFRRLIASKTRT